MGRQGHGVALGLAARQRRVGRGQGVVELLQALAGLVLQPRPALRPQVVVARRRPRGVLHHVAVVGVDHGEIPTAAQQHLARGGQLRLAVAAGRRGNERAGQLAQPVAGLGGLGAVAVDGLPGLLLRFLQRRLGVLDALQQPFGLVEAIARLARPGLGFGGPVGRLAQGAAGVGQGLEKLLL